MAITLDGSTPAAVNTQSDTSTTNVTASFSPPAGSMVVIAVAMAYNGQPTSIVTTCKDSLNNSYTAGPNVFDLDFSYSAIFTHIYTTAPGSITVTVTRSGTGSNIQSLFSLTPYVLDNVKSSQSGAASNTAISGGSTTGTGTITPTAQGSWVIIVLAVGNSGQTFTASGGPSLTSDNSVPNDTSDFAACDIGHFVTTSGEVSVSQTSGWTYTSSADFSWAALEILPANITNVSSSDVSTATDAGEKVKLTGISDAEVTTDAGEAVTAHLSDTDVSTASDAGAAFKVSSSDASTAADSPGVIHVSDTDASRESDAGEHVSASLSSSDASTAADSTGSVVVHPPAGTDASTVSDAGEQIRVIPVPGPAGGDDFTSAADGGESINGSRLVSDTETVRAVDSGFTFISDTDASQAADAHELLAVTPAGSPEGCTAADAPTRAWPHDFDTLAGVDAATIYRAADTDACQGTDQQNPVRIPVTDALTCSDSEHETVFVYAYQTLNRWTGGGFEIVRPRRPAFQAGPSAVQQALAPRRVWVVRDLDGCRAREDQRTALVVTVTAAAAVSTGAWAVSLGLPALYQPAREEQEASS